jgi:molybdate transport system substrate-binding protein
LTCPFGAATLGLVSMRRLLFAGVIASMALLPLPLRAGQAGGPRVLIFAAASLQTVLDELMPTIGRETGTEVVASYAASSALARQIENGAPADLFISADLDWMDYVASRGLIQPSTRVKLLGNALVLIAPARSSPRLTIAPGFPLAAAIGAGRIALADPEAVPAGKYARAALESLGVWAAIAPRVAAAENVRAALLLVSRGEAPFGIVYRTDAAADPGVRIVDTFPAGTHAPIVYPAALTSRASARAAAVLESLQTPAAMAAFARQGFTPAPGTAIGH